MGWIMDGFLDFICGSSQAAKELRDGVVFYIIPMLNPDGVINGNYRASLAGVDLNRNWQNPNAEKHPIIYNVKSLLKSLNEKQGIVLYLDLHGHSRKDNVFLYGCVEQQSVAD